VLAALAGVATAPALAQSGQGHQPRRGGGDHRRGAQGRAISHMRLLVIAFAGILATAVQAQATWVLEGAKIYLAPDVTPISGAKVVVAGTKIKAIADHSDVSVPAATKAPECNGGIVVAGFQNSHVHFTGDEFLDAGHQPAEALTGALTQMLTRYGYTTVFDITSDRDNTLALRARIDKGEVRGPRILTVGLPLFPPQGLPIYISHFRKELLDKLPQPASVDEALTVLRENFAAGTDATKLFIATPQGNNSVKRMPADIARAAVDETHRRAKLVFAHPTDIEGVQATLDAHVDILAHPPLGAPAPWPESLMKRVLDARISMVPTLKLFQFELEKQHVPSAIADRLLGESVREFGKFSAIGGQVLFGTDVGYMTDYDPTREYELMATAGMTPMQILASLTTAPAARWKEQRRRGRLAAGMDADILVLDADPVDAASNFAKVRCAIRNGEVIYARR
jgi:imidazolonepropionase-like amidohydrolase